MGHNPYTYLIHNFFRVCSNPNPFTLQLNRKSNLKGRIHVFLVHLGVLPTTPQQVKGLCDLFHKNPRQRRINSPSKALGIQNIFDSKTTYLIDLLLLLFLLLPLLLSLFFSLFLSPLSLYGLVLQNETKFLLLSMFC